jgi:biotin-dependent carboxylase-like uncharacterized protein
MTFRILQAGLYTLVVDHGRPRSRSLGVPVGGAADRFSLAVGNALVGNPPDAAALEINLSGPTLEALGDLACVVQGAPFSLKSDRQTLQSGTTFTLHAGEQLRIGSSAHGARAYLCVHGGIQTPLVLGSRSGLAPLTAGTELPCRAAVVSARFALIEDEWNVAGRPPTLVPRTVRVLPGAHATLSGPSPRFLVSAASNRMGLRLQGSPLAWPGGDIVSEPVCPGTVQLTRDGQCIILGMDGQTIGGYPKIAQVISADLDLVGQLRPGDEVVFTPVSLAEAEALYRHRRAVLDDWLLRLAIFSTEAVFNCG